MVDQPDTTVQQAYDPVSQVGNRHYDDDQFIFRQDERGDQAYIIKSGKVEIIKETEKGNRSLRTLSKGALFGEMALIDDQPRMASAKTVGGPVEVLVISRKTFKTRIDGADPFIRGLLSILTDTARHIAQET